MFRGPWQGTSQNQIVPSSTIMFASKPSTTASFVFTTTANTFSSTIAQSSNINFPTSIIQPSTVIKSLSTNSSLTTCSDNLSPNKQARPLSLSTSVIRPAAIIGYPQQHQVKQLQHNKALLSPPLNLSTTSANTPVILS